jgi:hypothetical protein
MKKILLGIVMVVVAAGLGVAAAFGASQVAYARLSQFQNQPQALQNGAPDANQPGYGRGGRMPGYSQGFNQGNMPCQPQYDGRQGRKQGMMPGYQQNDGSQRFNKGMMPGQQQNFGRQGRGRGWAPGTPQNSAPATPKQGQQPAQP